MMNSEGVVSVLMEAEISYCWSSDVLQMFPARCTLLISSVGKQKCTRLNALIILLTNSNHLSGIVPTHTRTLCAWDGKNQVTEESQIHDYQSINRFRTVFFCKLGNKIRFLLVMCINGAYEAQWGHVWSSRRPLQLPWREQLSLQSKYDLIRKYTAYPQTVWSQPSHLNHVSE